MEGEGEERVAASQATNVSCIPLKSGATKFLDFIAATVALGGLLHSNP